MWWRRLGRHVFLVLRVIAPGSVLVDVVDDVNSALVSRVIASPFFTRPRVLSGENTHTARTALLFLYTLPPVAFTAIFGGQDFGICFSPHSSSGLCFVSSPHRHSGHSVIGAVLSPCVLRRQYSERKVVVCPYHTHRLRTSLTPWF